MSPSSSNWLTLILVLVYTALTGCINLHGHGENSKEIMHAFSVMMNPGVTVESASSPIIVPFQTIVTDIGGGFDPVSSIFLIADNGQYFFAFNFVSGQSSFADVRLSVNGQHKLSAMAIAGQHLGSNQGILTLKSGDQVFLELQPHGKIENTDLFACFSGYLLNKTSAFTVARTSSWSSSGIFPFNEIITNIGNGYDSASHKFTASTSGIYLFIINGMSSSRNHGYLRLYANGTGMVTTHKSYNGITTGQNCVILPLKANEKVWIINVFSYTIHNATFTGHLLFELDSRAEKIAFSVGRTTQTVSTITPVRMIFDHEFTNEGLGFHFEGGLFEAPIDGIYVLFFNSVGQYGSGNTMLVYLHHSSQKISAIYGGPYHHPAGANHIIIRLLQFESVWLDLQPNSRAYSASQPNLWTSFSGYLLYSI